MGSIHVGRLPQGGQWGRIVGLLHADGLTAPRAAGLTLLAAERRLLELRGDPSLTHCLWLLTRLAAAARSDDFAREAGHVGVAILPGDTALQVVARVADQTRAELGRYPESGPFGEVAALALRSALAETVGTEGRSLLGSSAEDLARAFRRHSTASQFGELSARFFGAYLARTLRFYVERELMHAVGGGPLPTAAAAGDFAAALDRHARQSARIVEDFAAAWYSKRSWETDGRIGRDDVQAFAAHALTKLRKELERQGAPS